MPATGAPVVRKRDVHSGMECIAGTRIPARYIKALYDAGVSVNNIKELHYPELSTKVIKEVLAHYS